MTNPRNKSLTELAMQNKREAYVERMCKPGAPLAPMFERKARELLTLPHPPDVGAGGEVVNEQTAGLGYKRANIRDTLRQSKSRTAEDASIRRTDLLMQPSFDCVALGIDAAESINASDSLEKMLAHQMAVAHEMAMRMAARALSHEGDAPGEPVEACRLANAAARLMGTFQDGMLTLQRIRSGGNQIVTVQHVNVASGAQAVIGSVQTGGPKRRRRKPKNG